MPDVIEKSTEATKRFAGTAADATRRTADTAAETAQRATDQGREATMSGLRAIADAQGPLTEAGFEQSRRALEITSRVADVYRQAAERAATDVHALFNSWMSLGRGVQRWQQAYADAISAIVREPGGPSGTICSRPTHRCTSLKCSGISMLIS